MFKYPIPCYFMNINEEAKLLFKKTRRIKSFQRH